jgi:spermidine synthase
MSAADTPNIITAERVDSGTQSGMLRAMIRLLIAVGFGIIIILFILPFALLFRTENLGLPPGTDWVVRLGMWRAFLPESALLACGALVAIVALFYTLRKLEPVLDANALAQTQFLDTLDTRYVDIAIAFSAALSLFLELAMIRWQSSVLEFLAFYKNFSLLACFAGLGLGYALAARNRIPLMIVIPLLAGQFCFIMFTRMVPGFFNVIPFREQLSMGVQQGALPQAIILFLLLSIIFLLTALTFLPIGQLCGRLMDRRKNLRAYGLNLLGSLFGVLLMLAASFLWTPPLVWFALCFLGILLFHLRQASSLIVGIVFSLISTIVLAWWPIDPLWNRVYSPYQLLEIGTDSNTGLTLIRAAGQFYQRVYDFSGHNSYDVREYNIRDYYDIPFKAHPTLADVAVVGSGTGNDVAAALRAGAERVDAVEIDPAILLVGEQSHPEKPYDNPRVHAINNDARSFLRGTANKYDLIVYGLLDSHTLLSHGSSVRLDSFVYTVEGLREARNRLKPDGMISLSFIVLSESLGRKIYLMLQEVFDGRSPVSVSTNSYLSASGGTGVTFLISNDPNWALPAGMSADIIDLTAKYANSSLQASVSTDDWPFFYMPQRVYPVSYLIMISQILVLSLLLVGNFFAESPRFSHLSFFFLGVGFMLVETKGITEMGLTFGNTWQVIGIVIAGILTMAFVGNCLVQWLNIKRPLIPYLFLLAALALGWSVAGSGGLPSTFLGRLETVVVLSLPLLFSGIVFSTLLSARGHISGIMAMNLLGAMLGGLLEYNSMYFGFRALYLMAMACYVLAFVSELAFRNKDSERPATIPAGVIVREVAPRH